MSKHVSDEDITAVVDALMLRGYEVSDIAEVPFCEYCKTTHFPGVGVHKKVDGKIKLIKDKHGV